MNSVPWNTYSVGGSSQYYTTQQPLYYTTSGTSMASTSNTFLMQPVEPVKHPTEFRYENDLEWLDRRVGEVIAPIAA
jgi:hypothetical protein